MELSVFYIYIVYLFYFQGYRRICMGPIASLIQEEEANRQSSIEGLTLQKAYLLLSVS